MYVPTRYVIIYTTGFDGNFNIILNVTALQYILLRTIRVFIQYYSML